MELSNKEGWSSTTLTVQLQEQAGTAGRIEGSVSKRRGQGLEQIEAGVGALMGKPSAKPSTQYLNPKERTVARESDCFLESPSYPSQFWKGFGSC